MVRLLLFVCLTGIPHITYSQSGKFQFGLLVKGGNFTLPNAKSEVSQYRFADNFSAKFKPGYQYTFGIYGEYRFGPQFSILAELSYRLSYFERVENQTFQFFDTSGILTGSSRFLQSSTTNTLIAPFKVQFNPKKLPKWHFQAGAGICHNISVKNRSAFLYQSTGFPDAESNAEFGATSWGISDFRMHYTAGILFQISPHTRIGLEYLFERYYTQEADTYFFNTSLIDFIYYGTYPPNMHSFSVSLQHNLLHKI